MTLRTLRWLHRHIVNPCTMPVRMRMCNGPMHAIILLFIEGFLLCAFLAIYDYAPEADASNRLNSVHPFLNGQSKSLPITYTCEFNNDAVIFCHYYFSCFPYYLFYFAYCQFFLKELISCFFLFHICMSPKKTQIKHAKYHWNLKQCIIMYNQKK